MFEDWKQRKIGHYENRIRSYSHPYKVFQYFASKSKNGEDYMTPDDFIRSLQPYIELQDGVEVDHRYRRMKTQTAVQFFKLADVDGDGLIDFNEYMIFASLLMIPEQHFELAFRALDSDGNGFLTNREFTKLLDAETDATTYFSRLGRREHDSVGVRQCHGMMRLFFGPDGRRSLHRLEFIGFMKRLRHEVLKLEFYHLPVDVMTDTIGVHEMAALLVGYAELPIVQECTRRLRSLPEYHERVSFDEFVDLDDMVARLDEVGRAIRLGMQVMAKDERSMADAGESGPVYVTRDQLSTAIKAATGHSVKHDVIDALFHLLKSDDAGDKIDFGTLCHVVGHRTTMGLDTPRDLGFTRWLSYIADCTRTILFA
ncbi:hypothetical protein BCR44DRAFT_63160 [Catenaria anguillulae PL171]|uniref:EF-hand domain-containing protein n=1 Tax=Catenaria anguillulae PL171 TaxID=765915 RepID=A0A1Y2HE16_9FUNG|nr:hypothetical protein BCR44DRAFT_63160 [Catenaria anguillulae PL171]